MANPGKFRVNPQGQILNAQNKPILESNISESLSRLLSPKLGEASPRGTNNLAAAIKRDPEANQLYEEGRQISREQQRERRGPSLW